MSQQQQQQSSGGPPAAKRPRMSGNPGAAPGGGDPSQADTARRGLVSVNNLDYVLNPDLSVSVSRANKKHFFQQTSYQPGGRAICILNSGAEYVDPQNSYLSFVLRVPTLYSGTAPSTLPVTPAQFQAATYDQQYTHKVGSAINWLKRIVITSRSGDEIERIENLHLLAPILDRYIQSSEWVETVGKLPGYSDARTEGAVSGNPTAISSSVSIAQAAGVKLGSGATETQEVATKKGQYHRVHYCIPMACISGLFRSFDRLLPSMLCSGLRFEIELSTSADAVGVAGGNKIGNAEFAIEDPQITLDQYQLTDSIQRVLNEESAMRGLEVTFTSWYNYPTASGNGGRANIEVRKAVSRALGILTTVTPSAADGVIMSDLTSQLTNYQVRLGSLYFPQQPIKITGDADNVALAEMYHHTLRGMGKIKNETSPTSVRMADFAGKLSAVYTDLERSTVQKLSGVPINNSRVAEVRFETANSFLSSKQINCWLHYVRLCRVFLQNVEVEE